MCMVKAGAKAREDRVPLHIQHTTRFIHEVVVKVLVTVNYCYPTVWKTVWKRMTMRTRGQQ